MRVPANDRLASGAAALAVEALFALLVLVGLAIGPSSQIDREAKVFTIAPLAKKAELLAPPRKRAPHPAARAGRPNLRAQATPIVQPPPPQVPVPIVVPITAAPVAGDGLMSHSGAAGLPGDGSGSGDRGSGPGAGGAGNGDGGGGGGTAPRRIKGRLRDEDYPRALWEAGIGGTVSVRYHVEIDGHVTGCEVTGSSGSAELDALTCRLIEQRYRFRPALNADGRKVRSIIVENQSWIIDDSELSAARSTAAGGK